MKLIDVGFEMQTTTTDKVDWLKYRIQPIFLLKMPDKYEQLNSQVRKIPGKWIEFSLGIFLLSTPTRRSVNGKIYRDVEAYDGLVVLEENKINRRRSITIGQSYYDFVLSLFDELGIEKWNIEFSDKVAVTATEWEIGTDYLKIFNDVLATLNYTPLFVDEYGYYTSRLYRSPQEKSIDVEYLADEYSVIEDGMSEELDLFSIPNKFIRVLNDPERPPIISTVTNENPESPTSYQSRGNRWITDYAEVQDIADQQALDEHTKRVAFESSQIFGKVSFTTALMPIHDYSNVIYLDNPVLSVNGKYAETSWKMPLDLKGKMIHEVRAVVNI